MLSTVIPVPNVMVPAVPPAPMIAESGVALLQVVCVVPVVIQLAVVVFQVPVPSVAVPDASLSQVLLAALPICGFQRFSTATPIVQNKPETRGLARLLKRFRSFNNVLGIINADVAAGQATGRLSNARFLLSFHWFEQ